MLSMPAAPVPDLNATLDTLRQQVAQQSQQQISKDMWGLAGNIGLTGLGAGMGARGLWGLLQQVSRNTQGNKPSIPAPVEFEIPVEEVEEEKIAETVYETGKNLLSGLGRGIGQAASDASRVVQDAVGGATRGAVETGKDYASGQMATTAIGHPAALPLWMGAGLAGTGAGWTLTDWLLDRRRRQHLKQELTDAEKEYNDALFGKVSADLDVVYDAAEKQAVNPLSFPTSRNLPDTIFSKLMQGLGVSAAPGGSFGPRDSYVQRYGGPRVPMSAPDSKRMLDRTGSIEVSPPTRPQPRPPMPMAPAPAAPLAKGAAVKSANDPWTPGNIAGALGGGALTWAALSSLLGASYGYDSARSRSRRSLLEQAQKERQRQRMEAMPTPMYAVPVPVSHNPSEEEMAEFQAAPSLKAAYYGDEEKGTQTGPFSADMAARVRELDRHIAASSYNIENNPRHAWFNPFAPGIASGPLARYRDQNQVASAGSGYASAISQPLVAAAGGGIDELAPDLAGVGGLLSAAAGLGQAVHGHVKKKPDLARAAFKKDVDKYREAPDPAAEGGGGSKNVPGGPFSASQAAGVVGTDDLLASIVRNRKEHGMHYLFNPFVQGPIMELLTRAKRRIHAGMHNSWPGTLSALPTLGIAPLIMGNQAKQDAARQDYARRIAPYEGVDPLTLVKSPFGGKKPRSEEGQDEKPAKRESK